MLEPQIEMDEQDIDDALGGDETNAGVETKAQRTPKRMRDGEQGNLEDADEEGEEEDAGEEGEGGEEKEDEGEKEEKDDDNDEDDEDDEVEDEEEGEEEEEEEEEEDEDEEEEEEEEEDEQEDEEEDEEEEENGRIADKKGIGKKRKRPSAVKNSKNTSASEVCLDDESDEGDYESSEDEMESDEEEDEEDDNGEQDGENEKRCDEEVEVGSASGERLSQEEMQVIEVDKFIKKSKKSRSSSNKKVVLATDDSKKVESRDKKKADSKKDKKKLSQSDTMQSAKEDASTPDKKKLTKQATAKGTPLASGSNEVSSTSASSREGPDLKQSTLLPMGTSAAAPVSTKPYVPPYFLDSKGTMYSPDGLERFPLPDCLPKPSSTVNVTTSDFEKLTATKVSANLKGIKSVLDKLISHRKGGGTPELTPFKIYRVQVRFSKRSRPKKMTPEEYKKLASYIVKPIYFVKLHKAEASKAMLQILPFAAVKHIASKWKDSPFNHDCSWFGSDVDFESEEESMYQFSFEKSGLKIIDKEEYEKRLQEGGKRTSSAADGGSAKEVEHQGVERPLQKKLPTEKKAQDKAQEKAQDKVQDKAQDKAHEDAQEKAQASAQGKAPGKALPGKGSASKAGAVPPTKKSQKGGSESAVPPQGSSEPMALSDAASSNGSIETAPTTSSSAKKRSVEVAFGSGNSASPQDDRYEYLEVGTIKLMCRRDKTDGTSTFMVQL